MSKSAKTPDFWVSLGFSMHILNLNLNECLTFNTHFEYILLSWCDILKYFSESLWIYKPTSFAPNHITSQCNVPFCCELGGRHFPLVSVVLTIVVLYTQTEYVIQDALSCVTTVCERWFTALQQIFYVSRCESLSLSPEQRRPVFVTVLK